MAGHVAIIGSGSWGLTLGNLLANKGIRVKIWGRSREKIQKLRETYEDRSRLPGIKLHSSIEFHFDLKKAIDDADLIVLVVPSQAMRDVVSKLSKLSNFPKRIVSAAKGIEIGSGKRMSEVIKEVLGDVDVAALSGPSIALEVAKGEPTSVVVASEDELFAKEVQFLFHTSLFRVYRSQDIVGVELGGALKNIIAIAAGMADGLGFGANTKGALLTRGLAEIIRLGVHMGAQPVTFAGLSGMGDLITTCFSRHSRNRYVGEELGKGKKLKDILSGMNMVAEGVYTTEAAFRLARRLHVEMPITEVVRSILRGELDPKTAMQKLLEREPKPEYYLQWAGL